jgi:hypothetical protein
VLWTQDIIQEAQCKDVGPAQLLLQWVKPAQVTCPCSRAQAARSKTIATIMANMLIMVLSM